MIEVATGLWVGNQIDYEKHVKDQEGWAVVHACKEPYHRQALGYNGRGAPKDHEEYHFARRGNRLALNLIDADDAAYIPEPVVEAGLSFIEINRGRGLSVLVHCNQGGSRAPTLALLYLGRWHPEYRDMAPEIAIKQFREVYPQYEPAEGMRGYLDLHYGQ